MAAVAHAQAVASSLDGEFIKREPDWAAYWAEATRLVYRQIWGRNMGKLPLACSRAWTLAAKMAHHEYLRSKAGE